MMLQNQNLKVDNLGNVSQIGGPTLGRVDSFGNFNSFNSSIGNGRMDNMNRLQETGGPNYGKVGGYDSFKSRHDNQYGAQDHYRDNLYKKPDPILPFKSPKFDDYEDDYDDCSYNKFSPILPLKTSRCNDYDDEYDNYFPFKKRY